MMPRAGLRMTDYLESAGAGRMLRAPTVFEDVVKKKN
jgi:hypothetical protein